MRVLAKRPAGSRAARSAIDEALHDLWGKKLGQPLYKLFGLNPNKLPLTSFTIGIDEPEVMAEQAKESSIRFSRSSWGVKRMKRSSLPIREVTDAKLLVDANAGWTPRTGPANYSAPGRL